MKKIILSGIVCAYLFAGCHNHPASTKHDHSKDEKTELHDHEAEEHEHEAEEAEHKHLPGEVIFPKEKAEAINLETETIQPHKFANIIKTSGSIQAAQGEECTVVANVSGIISLGNLPFQDGVAVKKGQSILSIASKNLSSGDIAIRLRSTYETAKKEYERTKKLVPQQIVSQKEYEQAKMAYENAKAAYEAIKNNENNKGIALLSPIDGYLKNLLVKEGDYVTEGQPVVTVTQNRKLTLKAEISEKYYALLSSVKSANFRTPYEETVYELSGLNGRIISYGKSANDNSYYVPVIFEFDNKGAIIPGTFVEIWLLGKEKDNILTVPTSALIEEQGLYFVYRQTNEDGYMKTEVKLGSGNGEEFEVLSGLKAGDVVVTKGAYQIKLASASNIIPAHTHNH